MENLRSKEREQEERRQKEHKLREIQCEIAGMQVACPCLAREDDMTIAAMTGAMQGVAGDDLLRSETPSGTGIIEQSQDTSGILSVAVPGNPSNRSKVYRSDAPGAGVHARTNMADHHFREDENNANDIAFSTF